MGECKTITIKELLKDNPRYCLSSLRAFNRCYDCKEYFKCESKIINKDWEIKQAKLKDLNEKVKELNKEIEGY